MSELPQGWAAATIGDVADLSSGYGFPKKLQGKTTGEIPFAKVRDISFAVKNCDGNLDCADHWIDSDDLSEMKVRPVPAGSVVFAKIGEAVRLNRRALLKQATIIDNNCMALSPTSAIDDPRFLLKFMNTVDLTPFAVATTVPSVRRGDVESVPLNLPPIPEQRRIVAKLDRLSARSAAARDHLARTTKLATRAKQAILGKAFHGHLTDAWRLAHPNQEQVVAGALTTKQAKKVSQRPFDAPFEIPRTWQWLRLPELGDLDRGKSKHRPRNDDALFGTEYPFVQTGDVRAAPQYLTEYSKAYSDFGLAQSRLWPVGTVCITIAANIAETAILGIDACFPDSVVGFTAGDDRAVPEYVEYFIRTVRADLETFAPATAQKNINLETLYDVRVPTPPVAEQAEIVRRIEAAFARIDRITEEASRAAHLLDRLDERLLAKAFCGELVPQDPEDEPAEALLTRIRETRAAAPKSKRSRKHSASIAKTT